MKTIILTDEEAMLLTRAITDCENTPSLTELVASILMSMILPQSKDDKHREIQDAKARSDVLVEERKKMYRGLREKIAV